MQQINGDMGGLLIPVIASPRFPGPTTAFSSLLGVCRVGVVLLQVAVRMLKKNAEQIIKTWQRMQVRAESTQNAKGGNKAWNKGFDVTFKFTSSIFCLLTSMCRSDGEHGGQGGGVQETDSSDHLQLWISWRNWRFDHPVVLREWNLTRTSTRGVTEMHPCLLPMNL